MQLISPSQGERVSGDEIETFLREDTTRMFHFGSRSRRLNSLEFTRSCSISTNIRINRRKITRFRLGEFYFRFVLRNSFFLFFLSQDMNLNIIFLVGDSEETGIRD